jgi:hypothetical protein
MLRPLALLVRVGIRSRARTDGSTHERIAAMSYSWMLSSALFHTCDQQMCSH